MNPDRVSQTAANIAIKYYGLSLEEDYRPLADHQAAVFYEQLTGDLPVPFRCFHHLLKRRWIRRVLFRLNESLLPGDLMHVLVRKRLIGQWVAEQLQREESQLVVPGAGFDHLSAHCSRAGTPSIETDLPRMASFKREWVDKRGLANERLDIQDWLPHQSLSSRLDESPLFLSGRDTVVVMEGLLAYLAPAAAFSILKEISTLSDRVTLITTLFSLEELTPFQQWVYRSAVRLSGEPLKLGCNREQFSLLLRKAGFRITRTLSSDAIENMHLRTIKGDLGVLNGFYLFMADGGKNGSN